MTLEIVSCVSFARDVASPTHDLVRAWRAGDRAAAETALRLALATLAGPGARLSPPGTLLVAVPGHRAGAGNPPCEELIAGLAARLPGVLAGRGVLARVADAPEGKAGPARDAAAEVPTLRWDSTLAPRGISRVLLVDDVIRSGASLDAAAGALPVELRPLAAALAVFRAVQAGA